MKDLHLVIPDSLAEEVERLASELGETRSGILRRALEEFISSRRSRKLALEMKQYAERMAGYSGEFVKKMNTAISRKILKESQW